MSVFRLLIKELWHRRLNFTLGLVSVIAAVAVFVALLTLSGALEAETGRLMRDLGFNVLILPKDTDMVDFWADDFASHEMPEDYIHRLAESQVMTVRHLLATLTKKITWRDRSVLLTGVLPEVPVKHRAPKPAMQQALPRGKVWVGYELARSFKLEPGARISVEGREFEVSKSLPESGSKKDITLFVHLTDAQEMLGKPGKINVIQALECKCKAPDRLATIRRELAGILPETQVTEFQGIAIARAETRDMVERYASFIIPIVLVVSALWVGLLALGNVRQRAREIGTLRAVGWGSGRIATLVLGKAIVLGLVGAALGYAVGTVLAIQFGPAIFKLTAGKIQPLLDLFTWSLIGTPLLCMLASYLPAMVAVVQDPAVTLSADV